MWGVILCGISNYLLFDDVDNLATALQQEAFTGKLLEKVGGVLQILDKATISSNLILKLCNPNLYLGIALARLDNIFNGMHRDNNCEDGDGQGQRYPKVFYYATSYVHILLWNMHKLMRLNRDVPLGVLLYPLHKCRYDALVYAPLGL